ncbi:hypothetical protein CIN_19100 [Commensalibacter intestini A911]|nr:hypothetical protein [Commensalibacter intestini]EHD13173.1 hypothetical protein CIN_19100 [Commensalibacter intestini A911]
MEKWQQCKDLSKFCRTENNKDPNALQQWQQERSKFSAECCWSINDPDLKDYDKEVRLSTHDIYKKYLENGKFSYAEADNNAWTAHYRMLIPLKSKRNVIIKMTFELSTVEKGITNQEIEGIKQLILQIKNIWNGNFALKVTDTSITCCNPIILPIEFDIQFAYKGEKIANGEKNPHKIKLYKIVPQSGAVKRPHLEAGKTFILETDKDRGFNVLYTYAHEFAHALGIPDHYGYDEKTNSIVQYYQPNGKLDDTRFVALKNSQGRDKDAPDADIMNAFNSYKIIKQQGWNIGIAAKK